MTAFLLLSAALAADPVPPTIALHTPKPGAPAVVRVTGLSKEAVANFAESKPDAAAWQKVFRVAVAEQAENATAMLGSYKADGETLTFEPRFPLVPGTAYRATFDPAKLPGQPAGKAITATLTIPKPDAPPAAVTAIYPSADTLPENTLRLYLHFSAPMTRGGVYQYLKLVRSDGKEVEQPFLELGEELWNPDLTRFTLLFDPGRIKQGLVPREQLGPAIEAGKEYTLVIDKAWKDGNGRGLKEPFQKSFQVSKPDDSPIDPEKWKMESPVAGGKAPLAVGFPKPIDRALLDSMVWVADAAGKKIDGTIAVSDKETKWALTPAVAWAAGRYQLVVNTNLEDVCGNRVGSPFEIDVFKTPTRRLEVKTVSRKFELK
jgi:hypothetical protein